MNTYVADEDDDMNIDANIGERGPGRLLLLLSLL